MIESINNIIFYIGYFCISGILIFLGIVAYIKSYELLMYKKWFFKWVFDNALENSLENTNDENFELWINKIRNRYKNIKEDK